jgi:hypothetical protein
MRSVDEIAERAQLMADGVVAPDMADWRDWSEREQEDAVALALYILRCRRRKGPQRRAMRLLRSWLSAAQREQLRRNRSFVARGSRGGRYRIVPGTGVTQRIERHGKRDYARSSYCLHPDEWIPPADIAIAHLLLLRTDEAAFLRRANEHRTELWDGAYLRRLREARAARRGEGGEGG